MRTSGSAGTGHNRRSHHEEEWQDEGRGATVAGQGAGVEGGPGAADPGDAVRDGGVVGPGLHPGGAGSGAGRGVRAPVAPRRGTVGVPERSRGELAGAGGGGG